MLIWQKGQNKRMKLTSSRCSIRMGSWTQDFVTGKFQLSDGIYDIFETNQIVSNDLFCFLPFVHTEDKEHVNNALCGVVKGEDYNIDYRIVTAKGNLRYVNERTFTIFDRYKKPVRVIGIIEQIPARNKDTFGADRVKRKYERLIRESCDMFALVNDKGQIKYVSESLSEVMGYDSSELLGKSIFDLFNTENSIEIKYLIEEVSEGPGKKAEGTFYYTSKNGDNIYLELVIRNMNQKTRNGLVVSFRDITKRVEMEKMVHHISTHDELTGLPNRIHLKETLNKLCKEAKKENKKFATMMLRVDRFNRMLDAIGHYVGDKLLVEVSHRLKYVFGEQHYICHYSEDRYAIIVTDMESIGDYEAMAKKAINVFSNSFAVDKYDIEVSINLGICLFDENNSDAESIIKHAEIALFWAKNEGKNKYKFYSSDIDVQTYKQFELYSDMLKAIDNDQFRVYYQPIMDLKTNRVIAAEALIRWEHPSWGMVSPMEFIPIAEETGYIMNIGRWVFKKVCEDIRKWISYGLRPVKVGVNISSVQFFESRFVENIIETIEEHSLDPGLIIIEITESILLVNTEKVINDLKRLRDAGIQIALDDFGTGYSSLAYLSSFNIDILKMDSSFIKNLSADYASTTITRHIINMAHELSLKVVAEGIETMPQLVFLKDLKCKTGQGYIYSKPLPEDMFRKILKKRLVRPEAKEPMVVSDKNKRKYFRVEFKNLLIADMTILELKGKELHVGNTKVLVKNISAGGLCFVTNLKIPVSRDLIMNFTAYLAGKILNIRGYAVWMKEHDKNLYEYGVEFVIDERDRELLMKDLWYIQMQIKTNEVFTDGDFAVSAREYFN